MDITGKTSIINLSELISFSRGDSKVVYKYLKQFSVLIPSRIEILKESIQEEDRKKIRQILHQMSPQLQFFGIKDIVLPIRRLEHEYNTMPMEDLNLLTHGIIKKLKLASQEAELILTKNF